MTATHNTVLAHAHARRPIAMPEYTFPAEDSISEHVPDDEEVTGVTYNGEVETVETEEVEHTVKPGTLREMDRNELYDLSKEHGVELQWSGDNADTEEEMRNKLREELIN